MKPVTLTLNHPSPTEPGWYGFLDQGGKGIAVEISRHGIFKYPPGPADCYGFDRITIRDISDQEFLHMGVCYRFDDVLWSERIEFTEVKE